MPPRFSLVIPAYNEAAYLPKLLDSIDVARDQYSGSRDSIDVIVANNASTDNTASLAESRGCRVIGVEKRAIAAARNGGAAIAQGEWLCFVDADSRIHPNTFNAIDATLALGKIVVGATGVKPDRFSPGIVATWLLALPVVWLTRVDAGVVFCRRTDFESVGGYDESLLYAEDIQLLIDLKRLGQKNQHGFRRARGAITITSTRKFDKYGDWHYFTHMPRVAFWMLFNKRRTEKFTRAYWYEDR